MESIGKSKNNIGRKKIKKENTIQCFEERQGTGLLGVATGGKSWVNGGHTDRQTDRHRVSRSIMMKGKKR